MYLKMRKPKGFGDFIITLNRNGNPDLPRGTSATSSR